MPDKYNITELIPTNNKNEISALLTFSDAAMNTDLAKGKVVLQTLKDQWCLSIQQVSYNLVFTLNYDPTSHQVNGSGTVKWSLNRRDLNNAALTRDWVNFYVGPPNVGILCSFNADLAYDNIVAISHTYLISLKLTFTVPENLRVPFETSAAGQKHLNTWKSASLKIARLLLNPTYGDVVFVARDADDLPQKLYAYRGILAGNSEYFANSLKPEWRPKVPESSGEGTDHRQVISMEDPKDDIDFVTLHNILYFIYIGCVNLPLPKRDEEDEPLPEGYPDEADPYLLFRNANKFLLPSLKERCLYNLKHDVNAKNVAERLFHPDCEYHEELRELYFGYLVANYDAVKETEGWERAVCDLDDVSPSMVKYRSRLLFDISKKGSLPGNGSRIKQVKDGTQWIMY